MPENVYRSDPGAAPDSEFLPGQLRHLVAGNRGRLLDPRRTPVHITDVRPQTGFFEVEIDAFEDTGARWLIPLESVTSYQFATAGATATGAAMHALRDAVTRCDVQITITAGATAQAGTRRRLGAEQARAGDWLTRHGTPPGFDPEPFIEARAGWPAAQDWLTSYLTSRDLADIDQAVTSDYVSNPWAGDLVLGHLIVLAELGLGTLTARAPRDPESSPPAGTRIGGQNTSWPGWASPRRCGTEPAATSCSTAGWHYTTDPRPQTARPQTLTTDLDVVPPQVAGSHYQSSEATMATLYRQRLTPQQLFMTFLETTAMNRQFREAEAVLLANGQHLPPAAI